MNYSKEIYEKQTYILTEWIDRLSKHVYIFAGKDNPTVDETQYKTDKYVKSVKVVPERIYPTDSIETIKYKIAMFCLNDKYIDDIYMWTKCVLNDDNRALFKQNLFKNNVKLTREYINRITNVYFNTILYKSGLEQTEVIEDISDKLDSIKVTNKSLDFAYTDLNDFEEFFSPDPFFKLNETNATSLKTPHSQTLLYRFQLESNHIHFISRNTNSTQVDKAFYMSNKLEYNENNAQIIQHKAQIQNKFVHLNDYIDNMYNRIELLYFRVLPYSHNISINIKLLFTISNTSYTIPFIVYKSKYTNEYKINKIALSDMDKKQIDILYTQELKQQNIVMNRSNDTLIYYIKMNDSTFFYFLLSENGSYRIKYKFTKSNDVTIKDVKDSFSKLDEIYEKLNEYMIYKLKNNTNLFNSKLIDIIEYNTQNTITFKRPLSQKAFLDNVSRNNHFFNMKKKLKASIFQLDFVDTNNFYNMDSITSFIYSHMELTKAEMIEKLKFYFKLSDTEASDIYAEKRSTINLKISRKGKNVFAIRKYHTAVTVKINIMSDSSIKVNTINTQDEAYQYLIIYYLINLFNSNITKNKKLKPAVSSNPVVVNDENPDEVDFNDLIDLENMDVDLDELNEINMDMTPPKLNIETDIDDYTENTMEDDDDGYDMSESELSDSGKQTDYTTFVLNKLYLADKKLFLWNDITSPEHKPYSSKCQAVDYKQPVVINKAEKDKIDREHPGSYTGFVQTGSTPELAQKNFYICPKIWCRVSRVSITDEEFEKYGKKCPPPHNEDAMFFPKYGTKAKNNYFITAKTGKEEHWPSLMKGNKHPLGYPLPCCGKKPLKSETDQPNKRKNSNYISNISSELPLDEDNYGNLPFAMNKLLNNKASCVGIIKSQTHCYVRTGTNNTKDPLFNTIETLLNIDSLSEHISKKMKLEHFVFLNGGNTLKVFMNNTIQYKLLEPSEFKKFKMCFVKNTEYINRFNLHHVRDFLKSRDRMEIDKDDHMTRSVIREFLIFHSFLNFKNYIVQDNIYKSVDDIQHMLTFKWLNPTGINFLFLHVYKENVYVMNPKYYDFVSRYDRTKQTAIVLQIANTYEYLSKVSQRKKKKSDEIYLDATEVKPFLNSIESDTRISNETRAMVYHTDVTTYILSTNLKCVGMVYNNQTVVYLNDEIMLEYDEIGKRTVIFMDQIQKYTVSLDQMKKYNSSATQELINNIQGRAPLDMQLFVDDMTITTNDDEKKFQDNLYNVAKKVVNKSKLNNAIDVLNNALSNFTNNEKKYLLKEILKQNKIKYDDDIDENKLIMDLLRIPLNKIIDEYKMNSYRDNKMDIYMTYDDILNKRIFDYYKKYNKNFFTVIEQSSEDFVEEIDYIKIDHGQHTQVMNRNVVWSNLRKPIKPVSVERLFPTFEAVNEEITYDILINYANDLCSTITSEKFDDKLTKTIEKRYLQDKDKLFEAYNRNKNFEKHNIKRSKASLSDYTDLIKKSDYHYSLFELEVLSEMINYNMLIIGRSTMIINGGVFHIDNKSDKYLVFMYNIHENRHSFNLVVKGNDPYHVITKNDFSTELNKLLKLI